nr:immunoglobulin light chain junction region [Macaca mulatta]MOX85908.1 immunoglobulin light chain junction region [Macaca mulatta]MOX85995.1 immunoglobulin light chain junction region [Macaca mulatta]MOX86497.1 immunoglobulin light chain junction region [Macaca mulatta]MOX87057.1 immunoglobulin light chain junction region [Macaca mulatta]
CMKHKALLLYSF